MFAQDALSHRLYKIISKYHCGCIMENHANKMFSDRSIKLDGCSFVDCEFRNCVLVFHGGLVPTLVRCSFTNSRFEFDGPAANTLAFLSGIYNGMGEGGKATVEATFESIRTKRFPVTNAERIDVG